MQSVLPRAASAALPLDSTPPLSTRFTASVSAMSGLVPVNDGSGAVIVPMRDGWLIVPIRLYEVPSSEIQTLQPPQFGSVAPPEPPDTAIQTCGVPPTSDDGGSKMIGALTASGVTLRLIGLLTTDCVG